MAFQQPKRGASSTGSDDDINLSECLVGDEINGPDNVVDDRQPQPITGEVEEWLEAQLAFRSEYGGMWVARNEEGVVVVAEVHERDLIAYLLGKYGPDYDEVVNVDYVFAASEFVR